MYLRPAFTETDLDRIAGLIAAHSFGVLVTQGPAGGMAASHVPFMVAREGDGLVLEAHLGSANAQCAAIDGEEALAIFSGPHAYISPSWYVTQPAVPTWDYAAVHVHGRLEAIPDSTDMLHAMAAEDPGRFDIHALPEKFRAAMLGGIRGFRLRSRRIEAQWKMSQNRSIADRLGVIAGLRGQGESAVADLVAATLDARPGS
jgi:transcriptional regulator